MYELVKTTTQDDLYLHGIFKRGDKSKYAILNIHGIEGDFFSNNFVPVIADALKSNGHSFLSVQTRGMGNEYEYVKTNDDGVVIGSHFELLKEAYLDIDAWIDFLVEKGFHNIVLQGFSLGTYKVTRYMAEGKNTKYVKKLILLAPFDIHENANVFTKGEYKEYLRVAKRMVEEGKGKETIPEKFFIFRTSYQTMLSLLTFDHFGKMYNFSDPDNNFMLLNKIEIPVKAILGEKDPYFHPANPENPQEAMDILKLNLKNLDYEIINSCGHKFLGKEHEIAQSIVVFLEN